MTTETIEIYASEAWDGGLSPRESPRCLDWACENVVNDRGAPFSALDYPHHGAPGGPFDAIDSPQYQTIYLQWASRLGKTFIGQCAFMKQADCEPAPSMFASVDQKLATEVTQRTYRMLDKCPRLKHELRPPTRRRQDLVELLYCRQFIAWSRSVSTLADKAVQFGHANEVDKWEHKGAAGVGAKEADPLKLFTDRFKEFPVHKKIIESTPSIKGKSRVERGLLGSTNCRYYVPCPHCDRYQQLRLGDGESPGGIRWQKRDGGKSDKELARSTAVYSCEHCAREIGNDHRGRMMRAGVWVPEGCTVNDEWAKAAAEEWRKPGQPKWKGWSDAPWIEGTPIRDGRDAGYQLSSLYALQLSWGDIAAEFIDSLQRPANMQNFVNQWKGETWEQIKREQTWETLGGRCIKNDVPGGIVPAGYSLVTIGIDRQDDRFPFGVVAWNQEMHPFVIRYGDTTDFDTLRDVIRTAWSHVDGGKPITAAWTLFDSGFKAAGSDGVYEFCLSLVREGLEVWPSKGSSTPLLTDYQRTETGKQTARPGTRLYMMDTSRTQQWAEAILGGDKFGLYRGSLGEHEDFLQQLLNDAPVQSLDTHNQVKETWDRINTNIPNDYRDCLRNAYTAMLIATRGGKILPRGYTPPKPQPVEEPGRVRKLEIRR